MPAPVTPSSGYNGRTSLHNMRGGAPVNFSPYAEIYASHGDGSIMIAAAIDELLGNRNTNVVYGTGEEGAKRTQNWAREQAAEAAAADGQLRAGVRGDGFIMYGDESQVADGRCIPGQYAVVPAEEARQFAGGSDPFASSASAHSSAGVEHIQYETGAGFSPGHHTVVVSTKVRKVRLLSRLSASERQLAQMFFQPSPSKGQDQYTQQAHENTNPEQTRSSVSSFQQPSSHASNPFGPIGQGRPSQAQKSFTQSRMPALTKELFKYHRSLVNSYNTRPETPGPFVPRKWSGFVSDSIWENLTGWLKCDCCDYSAEGKKVVDDAIVDGRKEDFIADNNTNETIVASATPFFPLGAGLTELKALIPSLSQPTPVNSRVNTPVITNAKIISTNDLPLTPPVTIQSDEDEDDEEGVIVFKGWGAKRIISAGSYVAMKGTSGASERRVKSG